MEHGTDWEREAVSERWTELEYQRQQAARLRSGAVLVLAGLTALFWSLPAQACVRQGAWPQGCTAVVPILTKVTLFVGGSVALLVGLSRCRRAVGD